MTILTKLNENIFGSSNIPKQNPIIPFKFIPNITLNKTEVKTFESENRYIEFNQNTDANDISTSIADSKIASVSIDNDSKQIVITGNLNGETIGSINIHSNSKYYGLSYPFKIIVKSGDVRRYGIKIKDNGDNLELEYIYDAEGMTPAHMDFSTGKFNYGDWKDVWFIKDNKPLMLKSDGTVDYYLNPNDYSKKEDGTESDIANTSYDGNAMAQFPLGYIYRYWDYSTSTIYEILSNVKYDDNYQALAHTNSNGIIKDYFYWGLYEGSILNNKLRSISNISISSNSHYETFIKSAWNNQLNSGYYIQSWQQYQYFNFISTLITKSFDSPSTFGQTPHSQDGTTNRITTTGSLNDKGQFYGDQDRTTGVKVFHIENAYGNNKKLLCGVWIWPNDSSYFTIIANNKLLPNKYKPDNCVNANYYNYYAKISDDLDEDYTRITYFSSYREWWGQIAGMYCSQEGGLIPTSTTTDFGLPLYRSRAQIYYGGKTVSVSGTDYPAAHPLAYGDTSYSNSANNIDAYLGDLYGAYDYHIKYKTAILSYLSENDD